MVLFNVLCWFKGDSAIPYFLGYTPSLFNIAMNPNKAHFKVLEKFEAINITEQRIKIYNTCYTSIADYSSVP